MREPLRLLVLAPHPDDETLGAGGTIARTATAGGSVTVLTVAAHQPPLYPESVHEQTVAEARRAHAVLGVEASVFLDFPAVYLDQVPRPELNERIENVVRETRPQVILVPFLDRHVDHRVVFEAAMVAARPRGSEHDARLVAAYETVSTTHWNAPGMEPNFAPTWWVDVGDQLERKLEAWGQYESQLGSFPRTRSPEVLRALAVFRGSEVGTSFAEAFQVIRSTARPEAIT